MRANKYLEKNKLSPVHVFEDLTNEKVKTEVYNCIRKAGVYMILNLITGETYIGCSITKQIRNRFNQHLYNLRGSKDVAAAVQQYGLDNFAFIVLAQIDEVVTLKNNSALLRLEEEYFKMLRPEYNVLLTTGWQLPTVAPSKPIKASYYSEARRDAIKWQNYGKKLSPITIERIRNAAFARPPMSIETRLKVSMNSTCALYFAVSPVDAPADITTVRTIQGVADFCNCSFKTVQRAVKGNGIIKKTWRVKQIDKE